MTKTTHIFAVAAASFALAACGTTGTKLAQPKGVGPILGEIVDQEPVDPVSPGPGTIEGNIEAPTASATDLDRVAAAKRLAAQARKIEMRKREKERLEAEEAERKRKAAARPIGG